MDIKIKCGLLFRVVGEPLICEIDGLTQTGIWNMTIYDEIGNYYNRYDVFEDTIIENIKSGKFKIIKKGRQRNETRN